MNDDMKTQDTTVHKARTSKGSFSAMSSAQIISSAGIGAMSGQIDPLAAALNGSSVTTLFAAGDKVYHKKLKAEGKVVRDLGATVIVKIDGYKEGEVKREKLVKL